MKIIENQSIIIKKSNSKLGFSTTGGGNWEVWDRFLTYNNEKLFHIGNICGTCCFFFKKEELNISEKITEKEISSILNNGLKNLNHKEITEITKLFPNGEYELIITEIQPKIAIPNKMNDYFHTDLIKSWHPEHTYETNIPYYRGTSKKINDNEKLYNFFIPIYSFDTLNPECVKEYEAKILNGEKPTVLSLGVLDVKTTMIYPEDEKGNEINPEFGDHWCFANYIIDGHHKIMAANNINKPITLLTFVSKDNSWKYVDEMILHLKK